MIGRHHLLLALAAVVALGSSACTALLGGNDPIEIIDGGATGDDGADDAEPPDAAPEAAEDAPGTPEENADDSAQPDVVTDVDTDVDAFAPPADAGPAPVPDATPDATASCPPASGVPSLPPWPGVTQEINACSSTQLSTFQSDCLSGGTMTGCSTWQQDPNNAACMSCLYGTRDGGPPDGKGALNLVGSQIYLVNLPGCIELADPGPSGTACPPALAQTMECDSIACQSCLPDQTGFDACVQAADAPPNVCAPDYGTSQTACEPEYADGGAATTACSSVLGILDVICGIGP